MRCEKKVGGASLVLRVRGRGPGHGSVSRGAHLDVPNCARNKLTIWREDHFTVKQAAGIEQCKKRVTEKMAKELVKAKPGAWGCVEVRDLWATEEEVRWRPGHHWLLNSAM